MFFRLCLNVFKLRFDLVDLSFHLVYINERFFFKGVDVMRNIQVKVVFSDLIERFDVAVLVLVLKVDTTKQSRNRLGRPYLQSSLKKWLQNVYWGSTHGSSS